MALPEVLRLRKLLKGELPARLRAGAAAAEEAREALLQRPLQFLSQRPVPSELHLL